MELRERELNRLYCAKWRAGNRKAYNAYLRKYRKLRKARLSKSQQSSHAIKV